MHGSQRRTQIVDKSSHYLDDTLRSTSSSGVSNSSERREDKPLSYSRHYQIFDRNQTKTNQMTVIIDQKWQTN